MSKKKQVVDAEILQPSYYGGDEELPTRNIVLGYNEEHILEIQKCKDDICYFAENYFFIENLDQGEILIDLYPKQREALEDLVNHRFNAIMASRQTGKTTIIKIYVLWLAIFTSNQKIAILANKESTALAILDQIEFSYKRLPMFLKSPVEDFSKKSFTLTNRSKVFTATTSKSGIRGASVNLLVLDEAAFLDKSIEKEFWEAVFPVVSSSKKAKIFLISTPNGPDNLFHRMYSDGETNEDSAWHTKKIIWSDVPGRDEEWAKETKAGVNNDLAWQQEFECCVLDLGTNVLDQDILENIEKYATYPVIAYDLKFENEIEFKEEYSQAPLKIYEKPKEERIYSIGVDVAEGVGKASSTICVTDITDPSDMVQVAEYANNQISPYEFSHVVMKVANVYNKPWLLIERNSIGQTVITSILENYKYPKVCNFNPTPNAKNQNYYNKEGIVNHANTKKYCVTNMRYWLSEKKTIKINSLQLKEELETFERKSNGTWGKRKGEGIWDDRVDAFFYSLFILDEKMAKNYLLVEKEDENGKPVTFKDSLYMSNFDDMSKNLLYRVPTGDARHNTRVTVFNAEKASKQHQSNDQKEMIDWLQSI